MLIMSAKPATASAASESGSDFDRPNTIIIAPNVATTTSNVGPAGNGRGRRERTIPARSAPAAGAARSRPTHDGADVENREREDRRERDRVAEEHGDEVERDRAEEHTRVDDEIDPGRQASTSAPWPAQSLAPTRRRGWRRGRARTAPPR